MTLLPLTLQFFLACPLLLQSQEPSPELFERLAVSVDDEVALSTGHDPYEPRSKSVSPVQRKIREMEVRPWRLACLW